MSFFPAVPLCSGHQNRESHCFDFSDHHFLSLFYGFTTPMHVTNSAIAFASVWPRQAQAHLGFSHSRPPFLSAGGLGDCVSCGAFILFIAVINSVLGPHLDLSVLFKSVDIRAASSSGACGGCKPSACPSPPAASADKKG